MIVGLKKNGSSCVYFLITTYISSLHYHLLFVQSVPAHLIANLLEVDFIFVKGYSMLCKSPTYKVTRDDFIILKKISLYNLYCDTDCCLDEGDSGLSAAGNYIIFFLGNRTILQNNLLANTDCF